MKAEFLKKLFFTLFIFVPLFSVAQDSAAFRRWSIGINFSPRYSYRTLKVVESSEITGLIMDYRKKSEIPMISGEGGIDLTCYLKKKFNISIGILFSRDGYKIKTENLFNVNGTSSGTVATRVNFYYIKIPVKTQFVLGGKKVRFFASAGLTPSLMLFEQSVFKYNINGGKRTDRSKPDYIYNPFNLFATASFGIDFRLKKRNGLQLEPDFQYGLLQIISAPVTEHLWSAGLNIRYSFGL
jgi:hypothetical protein